MGLSFKGEVGIRLGLGFHELGGGGEGKGEPAVESEKKQRADGDPKKHGGRKPKRGRKACLLPSSSSSS